MNIDDHQNSNGKNNQSDSTAQLKTAECPVCALRGTRSTGEVIFDGRVHCQTCQRVSVPLLDPTTLKEPELVRLALAELIGNDPCYGDYLAPGMVFREEEQGSHPQGQRLEHLASSITVSTGNGSRSVTIKYSDYALGFAKNFDPMIGPPDYSQGLTIHVPAVLKRAGSKLEQVGFRLVGINVLGDIRHLTFLKGRLATTSLGRQILEGVIAEITWYVI